MGLHRSGNTGATCCMTVRGEDMLRAACFLCNSCNAFPAIRSRNLVHCVRLCVFCKYSETLSQRLCIAQIAQPHISRQSETSPGRHQDLP